VRIGADLPCFLELGAILGMVLRSLKLLVCRRISKGKKNRIADANFAVVKRRGAADEFDMKCIHPNSCPPNGPVNCPRAGCVVSVVVAQFGGLGQAL